MAPISLPVGPELAYPHEQIILQTASANPIAAAGIGKQSPAMKSMTKVEGAISIKLQWALWALLKSNQSLQLSCLEYHPLPVSGYPSFPISVPMAFLCSSPKCFSKNSLLKTRPRVLPGNKNPIRMISKAIMTATRSTQPQVSGTVMVRVVLMVWIQCMYIGVDLNSEIHSQGTEIKIQYGWQHQPKGKMSPQIKHDEYAG